jgi:hypothetical protein
VLICSDLSSLKNRTEELPKRHKICATASKVHLYDTT